MNFLGKVRVCFRFAEIKSAFGCGKPAEFVRECVMICINCKFWLPISANFFGAFYIVKHIQPIFTDTAKRIRLVCSKAAGLRCACHAPGIAPSQFPLRCHAVLGGCRRHCNYRNIGTACHSQTSRKLHLMQKKLCPMQEKLCLI